MPKAIVLGAVAAEVADLRIVSVDHEHRLLWQRRGRRPPVGGDVLQLAVTVELVAEEVAEQHRARPHAARDLGERPLVHLEERRARRRAASGASTPRRRRGSRPSGSRRGDASVRGSRRPWRWSSSCRSSRRRLQRRPAAALRARRSRSDRASRAACPAASCRRPCPRGARACRPRERRGIRLRDGHSSAGESTGSSLDRVNFARPNPKG